MVAFRSWLLLCILTVCTISNGIAQQVPVWKVCDTTHMQYLYTIGNVMSAASPTDVASIGEATGTNFFLHVVRQTVDSGKTWNVLYKENVDWGRWWSIVHPSKNMYAITGDTETYLGRDANGNDLNIFWSFLLTSRDGGLSWSKKFIDSNTIIRDIAMLSETYGAAILLRVGNVRDSLPYQVPDSLMVTSDGWKSWQLIPCPKGMRNCEHVFCFGEGTFGLATWSDTANTSHMYRTSDAGKTWTEGVAFPYMNHITFINDRLGWGAGTDFAATGSLGIVIKTTDGGMHWTGVFDHSIDPIGLGGFNAIAFSDSLHGIASGVEIYQTNDGGISWSNTDPPFHAPTNGGFGTGSLVMLSPSLALTNFGSTIIRYLGKMTLASPYFHEHDQGPIAVAPTTISWTPVVGAARYELRCAGDEPWPGTFDKVFANPIFDTIVSDTAFVFMNLQPAQAYFFWVKALNNTDTSDWRQTGDWLQPIALFTTVSKVGLKLPPVILSPATGTRTDSTAQITWSRVEGAIGYEVGYSWEGVTPYATVQVTDTNVVLTGLERSIDYSVAVRAYLPSDSTDWSKTIWININGTSGVGADDPISSPLLYPNPSNDIVHIANTRPGKDRDIAVYDQLGRDLHLSSRQTASGVDLDVRSLPAGAYTVLTGGKAMRMLVSH